MAISTQGISQFAGVNINRVDLLPQFAVGTFATLDNGGEAVYCRVPVAIPAASRGSLTVINDAFDASLASTANSPRGQRVGALISNDAVAANNFAWFQRKGQAPVRTAGAVAANTLINTTATAGSIDDDATVGSKRIEGVIFNVAPGAGGVFEAYMNDAFIGATL
jgi:hypothetical protein